MEYNLIWSVYSVTFRMDIRRECCSMVYNSDLSLLEYRVTSQPPHTDSQCPL